MFPAHKTLFKRQDIRNMALDNLEYAVMFCVNSISHKDCRDITNMLDIYECNICPLPHHAKDIAALSSTNNKTSNQSVDSWILARTLICSHGLRMVHSRCANSKCSDQSTCTDLRFCCTHMRMLYACAYARQLLRANFQKCCALLKTVEYLETGCL